MKATSIPRPTVLALALLATFLLSACGGGGDNQAATLASGYPSAPVSCAVDGQRSWVRDYLNDRYLWSDKQGTPNEAATSMAQYLDALLYKPVDKHSGVQSSAVYNRLIQEGRRIGYGYSLLTNAQSEFVVSYVEPEGPSKAAGLQRGDVIVTIDGLTAADIRAGKQAAVSTVGVPRNFVVKNQAGTPRSFTVESKDFALNPVLDSRVITLQNATQTKVGYLHYTSFLDTAEQAVADAVAQLRAAGVTEVVLDLRYNPGGTVVQASKLATLLGGSSLYGQVFTQYQFNSKYASQNVQQTFNARASLRTEPLANPGRVFVLTSKQTASASEMVINGLRPYRTVVTIGDTTLGKPYGFQPRSACDLTYSTVNFQLSNSQGFSDYANGLPADYVVADDFSQQLGDPQEKQLAAALNFISTGQYTAQASASDKTSAQRNSAVNLSPNLTPLKPHYWDENPPLPGAIVR